MFAKTFCNYTMFRNGFPDALIKYKLTKHKTIINHSGLPKYCVIAVISSFYYGKKNTRLLQLYI